MGQFHQFGYEDTSSYGKQNGENRKQDFALVKREERMIKLGGHRKNGMEEIDGKRIAPHIPQNSCHFVRQTSYRTNQKNALKPQQRRDTAPARESYGDECPAIQVCPIEQKWPQGKRKWRREK